MGSALKQAAGAAIAALAVTVAGATSGQQGTPRKWGIRATGESVESYSARIAANMKQYKLLGKELQQAKEQLCDAQYRRNHMSVNKRGPISRVVSQLKQMISEL